MLRCPPSRINLTASDVAGLDQRLAARHSARLSRQNAGSVHLAAGPQRSTRLSIVSADDNKGKKRAESSCSEATICNEIRDQPDAGIASSPFNNSTPDWGVPLSTDCERYTEEHSALCNEAARALENVVVKRKSPARSPLRQLEDGSYRAEQSSRATYNEPVEQTSMTTSLDGTVEQPLEYKFITATPLTPFTRRGNPVLGEIESDAYPVEGRRPTEPQPDHRLLSSARARRRLGRSQDVGLHEDSAEAQEHASAHHIRRPVWHPVPPVPELHVPDETTQSRPNEPLDPHAPVFLPRTRFGSAARSSAKGGSATVLQPHWGSVDTTHNTWNLRIRSTSHRNTETRSHHHYESTQGSQNMVPQLVLEQSIPALQRQHYRRSRGDDQNNISVPSAPNLQHYPLMRPPSSLSYQRRTSSQFLSPLGEPRDSSAWLSTAAHEVQHVAAQPHHQTEFHVQPAFISGQHDPRDFEPRTRSASTGVSAISRSTPNLLTLPISAPRIGSRGSSRSWTHSQSGLPSSNRVPSMVSAANGISSDYLAPKSTQKELDAAEEFVLRRNSPLDELAERFSRMRSVGRSWERPPGSRMRPSLLNGDPFRDDTTLHAAHMPSDEPILERVLDSAKQIQNDNSNDDEFVNEDVVALSLALPLSSPFPACPEEAISTPYLPGEFPTNPPTQPSPQSPTKSYASPESAMKRKPVPKSTAASKLSVYDDNEPSNEQPQTPADMTRSRRTKNRSNSAAEPSPIFVGRVAIQPPPTVPERHIHRNTYPSVVASQGGVAPTASSIYAAGVISPVSRSEVTDQQGRRRRYRGQRNSVHIENDVEGQLPGLEEDRRIWLSRRDGGTLDVTPPKEGRFERFLS